MKLAKKITAVITIAILSTTLFGVIAHASQPVPNLSQMRLYEAGGNQVYGGRVMYNDDGNPVFGQGCWFYGEDGDKFDANGLCAFMYDTDGNLISAPYGTWCWEYNSGSNSSRGSHLGGGLGRGRCGRW